MNLRWLSTANPHTPNPGDVWTLRNADGELPLSCSIHREDAYWTVYLNGEDIYRAPLGDSFRVVAEYASVLISRQLIETLYHLQGFTPTEKE